MSKPSDRDYETAICSTIYAALNAIEEGTVTVAQDGMHVAQRLMRVHKVNGTTQYMFDALVTRVKSMGGTHDPSA
mgnify:CR=1 FL=1